MGVQPPVQYCQQDKDEVGSRCSHDSSSAHDEPLAIASWELSEMPGKPVLRTMQYCLSLPGVMDSAKLSPSNGRPPRKLAKPRVLPPCKPTEHIPSSAKSFPLPF